MRTAASMAIHVLELGSCCSPNVSFREGTGWQIGLLAGSLTSTCGSSETGEVSGRKICEHQSRASKSGENGLPRDVSRTS